MYTKEEKGLIIDALKATLAYEMSKRDSDRADAIMDLLEKIQSGETCEASAPNT